MNTEKYRETRLKSIIKMLDKSPVEVFAIKTNEIKVVARPLSEPRSYQRERVFNTRKTFKKTDHKNDIRLHIYNILRHSE